MDEDDPSKWFAYEGTPEQISEALSLSWLLMDEVNGLIATSGLQLTADLEPKQGSEEKLDTRGGDRG